MRYRDGRRSICVSSQSGCPLTCTFCATGQMKFGRNLTAAEIVDQALHFRRIEAVDHCVFMGMGEPMMNLDAVLEACRRLPDLGITHRRTAISTVGWVPGIERLTECEMPIRLALSLHAPNDALRSELMPVNDRYPLADVLAACHRYHRARRRMVFVEYVMLAGVNDSRELAAELARDPRPARLQAQPDPVQPDRRSSRDPTRAAIHAFKAALERGGLRATVRLTRGRDIDAACGQLAAKALRPRRSAHRRSPPRRRLPSARWRSASRHRAAPRSQRGCSAAARAAPARWRRRPGSTTPSSSPPRSRSSAALESPAVERALVRVLEGPAAEEAIKRVLASPAVERAVLDAIDSELLDKAWERLLESDEVQKLIERIAEAPEVRAAITSQGVGLLEDVGRQVRRISNRLDGVVEGFARRLTRQPKRTEPSDNAGLITRALALRDRRRDRQRSVPRGRGAVHVRGVGRVRRRHVHRGARSPSAQSHSSRSRPATCCSSGPWPAARRACVCSASASTTSTGPMR